MKKVIEKSLYTFPKWSKKEIQEIPNKIINHKKERYDTIKKIPKEDRTFENTFFALESSGYGVEHNILLVHILMNLSPEENVRKISHAAEQEYEKNIVDIELDPELYKALSDYYKGNYKTEKKSLQNHEIKYVEDTMVSYKNLGFELPKDKQNQFKKLKKQISKLSSQFRFNINAHEAHILCTREELKGLSDEFIKNLDIDKKTKKYIVTIQSQHYIPFMKLAEDESKRRELAIKSLQKGGLKNIKILSDLIKARHDAAIILGYKNHIEKTLQERMAKSEVIAKKFLEDIYKKVEKKSVLEMKRLEAVKSKHVDKKSKMEFSDISFYSDKLYEEVSSLDTEYIKNFFEINNTVKKMLSLYGDLFGLSFSITKELPVWEKSVLVVSVIDKKTKEKIGYIYMDLYPRIGKYGHAMVTHATNGHQRAFRGNEYTMPVCALVCNFQEPKKDSQSLLSLRDVETLFHEFGHALHTVLTKSAFESQSGTNVAWDFVETPSQMLENFIYEPANLKDISRHHTTGKKLDTKTIKKIIDNKNFMMATHVSRQLMFGFFDFAIHGSKTPTDIVQVYNNLYKKITGCELPNNTYFPAGFGHMDGYDAGYYSYMWALVYAQDIYSKFSSVHNKKELREIGMEYRKKILEVGSSRSELESVIDFLGRKPNTKAFFVSQGI